MKKKNRSFTSRAAAIALILSALLTMFTGCAADTGAPTGMKLLSNDIVDYTLYIPLDWTADVSTGVVSAFVSTTDPSNISMTAFDLDNVSMSVEDYWKSYEEQFNSVFSDMEYESQNSCIFGGAPAMKYVYTATVTGISYKFMQIACIHAEQAYVFTYTSTPEKYDSNVDAVDVIIENFSFND